MWHSPLIHTTGHTDRFKALVCHAGLYNTISSYSATEELFFFEFEFDGSPWGETFKDHFSPHDYVKHWKTPTLVIHGAKVCMHVCMYV